MQTVADGAIVLQGVTFRPFDAASRAQSSGERRRLLFLLAFPPRMDATHGGARAMAHIVRALSARHEVAVLYLRGKDEPPIDGALQARCMLVEEVPRGAPAGLWPRVLYDARVIAARASGVPGWPAYWGARDFAERARCVAREWQPDVVHFEFLAMGQFASALADCGALRVLTPHEPYAAAAAERAISLRGIARTHAAIEAILWRHYERRVMRQMDAVVAFTERDQQALLGTAGKTRVVRIPLGTVLPEVALDPLGVHPPEVLFVGNFTHPPNADAALRLVRSIAPLLWARIPEARVVIVGPHPPASLRAESSDRVLVTGEVNDVTPYMGRASVVVAPVQLGGGMRVKVLEALAFGKAIVASSRALEGLDVVDGQQVMIADDDAAFASATADLIQDSGRRAALGARARAWALRAFNGNRWADAYDDLYRSLYGSLPGEPHGEPHGEPCRTPRA